jgi:hypothetical protein
VSRPSTGLSPSPAPLARGLGPGGDGPRRPGARDSGPQLGAASRRPRSASWLVRRRASSRPSGLNGVPDLPGTPPFDHDRSLPPYRMPIRLRHPIVSG